MTVNVREKRISPMRDRANQDGKKSEIGYRILIPRGGFSLIEIMVVLFIFSLALAWIVPNLSRSVQARMLAGHAGELSDLLKVGQYRAIVGRKPLGVVVDRDKGEVGIPRLGEIWRIPKGYTLNFSGDSSKEMGEKRWMLFQPGGYSQGETAWFCRDEECWEISTGEDGSIKLTQRPVSL